MEDTKWLFGKIFIIVFGMACAVIVNEVIDNSANIKHTVKESIPTKITIEYNKSNDSDSGWVDVPQ